MLSGKKNLFEKGLYLNVFLIVLFFAVLFFVFRKSYITNRNFVEFGKELNDMNNLSDSLMQSVYDFTDKEHSDDFYVYKRDAYGEKVYGKLFELSEILNRLKEKYKNVDYETVILIDENTDLLNDFEELFKILSENILKTGNENHGYIAHIAAAEEKTSEILKMYPELYSKFNNVKDIKNKLLSNGSLQDEKDFNEAEKKFLRLIKNSREIFSDLSEMQIVLDNSIEWLNTVSAVYKIRKETGTGLYSSGIKQDLYEIKESFKKNNDEIRKLISVNYEKEYKKYGILFAVSVFLFVILFTAIILYEHKILKNKTGEILDEFKKRNMLFDAGEDLSDFDLIKTQISKYVSDADKKSKFLETVISGKFKDADIDFNTNDESGKKLLELKEYLVKESEKRAEEEAERLKNDKFKDGILKFGKIIRQHFGDTDLLTFNLLTELVRFTGASIGGIYITEEKNGEKILRLQTYYAYNEKKIAEKEIKYGESLPGTCAADKSSIYIDKISNDYIKIVSGFGNAKPKSLLLIPVYAGDEVYGVIELASISSFSREIIKFVETISEDLAYTLSYFSKKEG